MLSIGPFRRTSRNRRFFSAFSALAATLGLLIFATPATAAIYKVGADAACDFGDLPSALFVTLVNDIPTPTIDTIYIAGNQSYTGEFTIQDQSVTLIGGFSSCSDPTPSGQTTIDRPNDERNFTISNSSGQRVSVFLHGLNLTYSGSSSGLIVTGGSVHISGDISVSFSDTTVRDGQAISGGGIYLDASEGGRVNLNEGASVLLNSASFGGGVLCSGGSGTISMRDDAAVAQNFAQRGGGLYSNGCELYLTAAGFFSGVRGNEAALDGGGVYLTGSGDLFSEGGLITDNRADRGGAIFVDGVSPVRLWDALISENHAVTSGGAVHAENGAFISVQRTGVACTDLSLCATLSGNSVDASAGGAALMLETGAYAEIFQARIADHESPSTVIEVRDDGTLDLEGVEFVGNMAATLVETEDTATFFAGHLSVVDNSGPDGSGPWVFHDNLGTGQSTIESSLFADDNGQVYGGMASDPSSWRCLLLTDASMAPPSGTFYVGNPAFVDQAQRDFRLTESSDAIDLCDDFGANPLRMDRGFNTRGVNDPDHPEVNGFYDAGAFEKVDIFTDGFESGNTSAWSETVSP